MKLVRYITRDQSEPTTIWREPVVAVVLLRALGRLSTDADFRSADKQRRSVGGGIGTRHGLAWVEPKVSERITAECRARHVACQILRWLRTAAREFGEKSGNARETRRCDDGIGEERGSGRWVVDPRCGRHNDAECRTKTRPAYALGMERSLPVGPRGCVHVSAGDWEGPRRVCKEAGFKTVPSV
ncbi:hypothetical protein B0H10DRAFT_1947760 [Mycena sp. CBHHK59/15]|nr:hypothetical protein B0H10DRAFT_1947760 [Mycena sp. CBHHK59/15]